MTIINPNSISGITSFTAEADVMNFYRSNGTLGSLQLNGCNFNTTNGISTFNNLNVGGTLTYEDVKNVDSVGIISARTAIHVGAGISAVGIITATSFRGDGSQLTGITETTINNNADNRVITGSGTANTLNGESSLTFDGTTLTTTQFNVSTGANAFETSANVFKGASGQKGVYLRSALSSATTPSYSSVDDTNTGIFLPGSDVFAVTTGGTERLRITSGGQVNIGGNYTQTFNALDVTGNIKASARLNANDAVFIWQQNRMSLGNSFIIESQQNTPFAILTQAVAQPIVFGTNSTERLRITSAGKLGLGVASPASESGWGNILHINSASAGAHIRFTDNTSGSGAGDGSYIGHYGNDTYLVNKESSGVIIFNTNSAERLRIKSDGGILQTKTGGNANFTISRNESVGTTDQQIGVIDFASNTAHTVQARVGAKTLGTSNVGGDLVIETRANGGSLDERLRITGDGLVKATNDIMVHGTVYGGNGGRRNWLDNGDMTIVSRYANCHFAGNYHSYGWVTDRYQNRGTNAQWSQDTNVPAGKGFVYSAKVNSGTGGSLCQSIELTRKGQHGMFANDTYWCVSLWSTQPINRSSNNGFCKDLGSNDYTAFDNVNPSSGNAYLETGETASGTSTGTFKRYYHIFQAPNSLSSNAFAVNFGWAINYSGSGGCYLTGFQCEQVPNANCKPSAYEHVDQATQLKRCQRYAFRQSDNSSATGQNPGYTRLINGYKRHDDDVHFNFFCPVPMTPYNNSSPPQGLSAWDVGTCTNMGGNLGGTVSNVRMAEMNWDTGWCMVMFDYSAGGTNVIIPSWEGFSFEVGGSHF